MKEFDQDGRVTIRVVHLITELEVGGTQTALYRLLAHRQDANLAPQVLCLYHGQGLVARRIRRLGIPVTDLRLTRAYRLDALGRLFRILRRERPHLLHCWLFHANLVGRLVGRLAGVPVIITSRRSISIGGSWRENALRATRGLDDLVLAVSEPARTAEIAHTRRAPAQVITIPNGVDVAPFDGADGAAVRQELGIPAAAGLAAVVGRLNPEKGHRYLLEAVAMLRPKWPALRLLVVGDGRLRPELEQLSGRLGLAEVVTFTGTRTDIPQVMAALDLLVLPSLWEGLPNVVLEGMATGLPIVATGVGGTPALIESGISGLLVPPADAAALAGGMAAVLSDSAASARMGRAARQRVQAHFGIDATVAATEQVYRELLAAWRAR